MEFFLITQHYFSDVRRLQLTFVKSSVPLLSPKKGKKRKWKFMATPSPLLGLDSACFKLNIEIPLHWKCRISPTCLLLKTLLENVLTLSCNSWIQARKDLPRWQKAASVIGSLITRPLVHIWKDNFTFSVPKAPSQNPFTFPHPYWIKERKCRTDALPRAPSFPRYNLTVLKTLKLMHLFWFPKNIHDHPS